MDATKLVLILMVFTIGTGLAKTTFSLPKIARKVSAVDLSNAVDWSQYADSVLIQVTRPDGHLLGNTICSSVVVNRRAILTSAHCADGAISMTVIFDPENMPSPQNKTTVAKDMIVSHPDYNRDVSFYANDLAILFLDQPCKKSIKIRPIPAVYKLNPNENLIRIGMGSRNGKNARNITNPSFVTRKVAGTLEVRDIYAVMGDSGGPIYSPQHELLGIHSTMEPNSGESSPRAYSAYLPYFKPWLEEQLRRVR